MDEPLARNRDMVPPSTAEKPRSIWDKILTTTPVVMTVAATLLAAQSSSEMTRAQYHRSLASQNQSKAGDQWEFFQAKRTRRIILEKTGDLLDAMTVPDPVEGSALLAVAERSHLDFRRAEQEVQRLVEAVNQARPALGADGAGLAAVAAQLQKSTAESRAEAEKLKMNTAERLHALAGPGDAKQPSVFVWLNTDQLPPVAESWTDNPQINQARQAVADRKSEAEINSLVIKIDPQALSNAIELAEANASSFDNAVKPIDKTLREVFGLVAAQVRLARTFFRAARNFKLALAGMTADESKLHTAVQTHLDSLERQAEAIKRGADELNLAFKVASNRFTARRYEGEARYNQETAYLYEIQVHQNSVHADRHLLRSHQFFYGLLGAQMAVTIATLALAVRQKSLLWGLASIAGTLAVSYGVYVYLDIVP